MHSLNTKEHKARGSGGHEALVRVAGSIPGQAFSAHSIYARREMSFYSLDRQFPSRIFLKENGP